MNTTLVPLTALLVVSWATRATTLVREDFAYPDGPLAAVSGERWLVHSGTVPLMLSGGLARLNQADATGGREDVNHPLPQSFDAGTDNTTQLYAGFTVNFSALPFNGGSSTAGSYFAHFKTSAANQFYARVGANTEGAAAGAFRLALASADWNPEASIEYPQDLQIGVTYDVVVRLDLSTDQSTLWINPADETSPSVTASDPIKYSGVINGFALRQGTTGSSPNIGGPGAMGVGQVRVATSFAGLRAIPEPSTWTLLLLGGLGMLARRRRAAV